MKQIRPTRFQAGLPLIILLISGMSHAQVASSNIKKTKNKEDKMSTAQSNKEVVRKIYDLSLNQRKTELLPGFISPDFEGVGGVKGPAGFEIPVTVLVKAFPDVQWDVQEIVAEGDKVSIWWKVKGTHAGQFQHVAATGKTVSSDGMAIFELKEGKVVKAQVLTDRLGFLQQLDALPADLASVSRKAASKGQVNFIDKFFIPAQAKKEFYERMSINRNLIKTLPGFLGDAAYEYTDHNGNLICVTVAQWENMEALNKAREVVQAEYKKEGFDIAAMMKRLNIVADRGVYTEVK